MFHIARGLLLLASFISLPNLVYADDSKPTSVQDLQYGEVLFHYYRQDYFNSIVRLNIAQQQHQLPHHETEAELLLGGLDLSYGLRNAAHEIFTRLLSDATTEASVRNRAWYHMARTSYERGDSERALHALEQIDAELSESNRAETVYLQSLLLLKQGRNIEAIKVMQDSDTDKAWTPFLTYNLGIAHIRTNALSNGSELLGKIGEAGAATEELRLLRDKANLALGFSHLKNDSPLKSRQALDRVRLEGPLSNKALLGAGWADAGTEAYSLALVPWMELGERDTADPAVQEALLAIPYAMSKMNLHGQAVGHYNTAIELLLNERYSLDDSIAAIRNGGFLDALENNEARNSSNWLEEIAGIEASPALRYQVQLMASYGFQEAVKNYRDLLTLQANLDYWANSMESYDDMLAAREARYETHKPAAQRALNDTLISDYKDEYLKLAHTIEQVEVANNAEGLATSIELTQLGRLQTINNRIDALPDDHPTVARLRDKHRFLKGFIDWGFTTSFKPRLWSAKQKLAELNKLLITSENAVATLQQADIGLPVGMSSFSMRASEKNQAIKTLTQRSAGVMKKQGTHIENLAIAQLEKQKQRLDSYLAQARFALAQTYDVALSNQYEAGL